MKSDYHSFHLIHCWLNTRHLTHGRIRQNRLENAINIVTREIKNTKLIFWVKYVLELFCVKIVTCSLKNILSSSGYIWHCYQDHSKRWNYWSYSHQKGSLLCTSDKWKKYYKTYLTDFNQNTITWKISLAQLNLEWCFNFLKTFNIGFHYQEKLNT